ncbi:MAG: carotenoid biosynthesis protein [Anaerolineae bacterium]|nr:carotenoid biosynthesis protein [Anaerolineae bacterium]
MIQASFVIFELVVFLLFALCLWHAVRHGRFRVMELLAGLVYGVFLELMTLRQLEAYAYGQFTIMIADAPLGVGVGWAVIIYATMTFTRQLDMPIFTRPLLNGLLALNIDLGMDVIAIRLGFWTWGSGSLDYEWFGVPWGNFWAWFIVVSSFSAFVEMFRLYGWEQGPRKQWLYIPLATVLSVLVLAITNYLYASVLWPRNLGLTGMLLIVGLALLLVITARPRPRHNHIHWVSFAVPLGFHLFFNVAGFAFGYYQQQPVLGAVGLLMFAISIALHLWPRLTGRSQPAAISPG